MRGAFVFDAERCTGCQACELACSIENDLGTDRTWRTVFTFNPDGLPGAPVFHLSLACNHCAEPACMHACPALAYDRDDATGAVLVDAGRCIGCRYCAWACPYGAPRFEPERGIMGKCTFCSHRIREGERPACAAYCPTGALDYRPLSEDQLVDGIEGLPATGLGPAIRILPGARRDRSPACLPTPGTPARGGSTIRPGEPEESVIRLASEWSLAAFTFLLALLFASVAGATRPSPIAFGVGAGGAAVLSLAHLGRRERAWRAILNLRRSWLSREVAAFGAFSVTGMWAAVAWSPAAAVVAVLSGLALLVAVDMVYAPVHAGPSPLLDDGGALLTGLYLAGLVAGDPWVAGSAGAIKVGAAVWSSVRGPGAWRESGGAWRGVTVARVGLGLIVPLAAWVALGPPLAAPILALAMGGEALGRARFYERLRIMSPAREMRRALGIRLAGGRGSGMRAASPGRSNAVRGSS